MESSRTREMTSFIVMDVLERAQELEREGAISSIWRSVNPILMHLPV